MVRDAVALEERGIPTVTLAHDKFVLPARAQARILNLPQLKIVSIRQPLPWDKGDDNQTADEAVEVVLNMLSEAEARPLAG